jgi:hypothetical protein
MTTTVFKACKVCHRIVEWRDPKPVVMSSAKVFPYGCPGGNRLEMCGQLKAASNAATKEGA